MNFKIKLHEGRHKGAETKFPCLMAYREPCGAVPDLVVLFTDQTTGVPLVRKGEYCVDAGLEYGWCEVFDTEVWAPCDLTIKGPKKKKPVAAA